MIQVKLFCESMLKTWHLPIFAAQIIEKITIWLNINPRQ
jgi:hypothetical protein